jgi:signal peptidase I
MAETPIRMGKLVLPIVLLVAIGESASYVGQRLMPSFGDSQGSMYPTIQTGDRFYSSRISLKMGRGDVITFEYPLDRSKVFIKRIVGVAGDTVQMIDGQLILNGVPTKRERTDEPCVLNSRCKVWRETLDGKSYRVARLFESGENSPNFGPVTLAPGYLFVLGDSRDNSLDSRYWGALPVELVKGNPLFVYWSSDESGIHWNRINQRIN